MRYELDRLDHDRRALALEVRLDEDSGPPRIRGYAAVFNQETTLFEGYREVIRPGAFKASLERGEADGSAQKALWNHDPGAPLASVRGRPPLRLWEDEHGLGFEFEANLHTSQGRDMVAMLRAGLVEGASFGFRAVDAPELARNTGQGVEILRELRAVDLFEVSPVSFPQYAGTEAVLRRLEHLADVDRLGREADLGLTALDLRSIMNRAPVVWSPSRRPAPRRDARAAELERQ